MKMTIHLIYNGQFGEDFSDKLELVSQDNIITYHHEQLDIDFIAENMSSDSKVVVVQSGLKIGHEKVLAKLFKQLSIRWTSVYLGPRFLRVGPLIASDSSPCFDCSSKRYIANPGSQGLATLEYFVDNSKEHKSMFEFHGYLPSTVMMAVSESIRQLTQCNVSGGFIRKVDLLSCEVTDASTISIHGCECNHHKTIEPADRFHSQLKQEISFLFAREG